MGEETCESFCCCTMGTLFGWLFVTAGDGVFGEVLAAVGFGVAGLGVAGLAVVGCAFLVTGVFCAVTTGGGTLIHSLKVISSKAKSFPHPPGLLFVIMIVNDVSEGGVVKISLCCFQRGDSTLATSPVPRVAIVLPDVVCRLILRFGNSGKGHFSVILHTFISQSPNSYVVPPFKPLTVVAKKVPVLYEEFTSNMLPDASPGV